jgi:hypothetical protein
MSRRSVFAMLVLLSLALVAGLSATATAKATYKVSKPKLSASPVMGVPFTVSGVIRPKATEGSKTVVRIRLLMKMDGHWDVMDTYRAGLSAHAGAPGTRYAKELTIPMTGQHAVRALQYRDGRLVRRSEITAFDVQEATSQQVAVDASSHADVTAPADTPLTVTFSNTGMGCGRNIHFQKASLFERTLLAPLTYASAGLPAGSYDWECSMGPMCHGGTLVVQ